MATCGLTRPFSASCQLSRFMWSLRCNYRHYLRTCWECFCERPFVSLDSSSLFDGRRVWSLSGVLCMWMKKWNEKKKSRVTSPPGVCESQNFEVGALLWFSHNKESADSDCRFLSKQMVPVCLCMTQLWVLYQLLVLSTSAAFNSLLSTCAVVYVCLFFNKPLLFILQHFFLMHLHSLQFSPRPKKSDIFDWASFFFSTLFGCSEMCSLVL